MRRTAARASLALLLAASLGLAAAAPASSTPARHTAWYRTALRHTPARFALPFTRRLGARGTGRQVITGVVGTFKVTGSPYRWGFTAATMEGRTFLIVDGFETLINGVQEHEWRFPLASGDLSIGRHLRIARIRTGAALGAFGQIALTFRPHGAIRTRALRCPDTHAVIVSDDIRRGTLEGGFHFTSGEGTLPDLDVTSMRGRAIREVITGAPCRGQGPTGRCYRYANASVASSVQGASVFGEMGQGYLLGAVEQHVAPAQELHLVIASSSGGRVFKMGSNGLVVDAATLAPLASGTLTFDTTSTVRRKGHRCGHVLHQKQAWSTGTLTLDLDSGAVDLTGPDLKAVVVTHER